MNLPRNVYRKGNGYRGVRMVKGASYRTHVYPTPELAAAALVELVEGPDGPDPQPNGGATVRDLLGETLASAEQTGKLARRALLRLERDGREK